MGDLAFSVKLRYAAKLFFGETSSSSSSKASVNFLGTACHTVVKRETPGCTRPCTIHAIELKLLSS